MQFFIVLIFIMFLSKDLDGVYVPSSLTIDALVYVLRGTHEKNCAGAAQYFFLFLFLEGTLMSTQDTCRLV